MASSKERRKRCRREGSTVDRDSPAKISKLLSSCPSQDGDDDFDGGSEDLCRPQRCQSIPLVPPSMSEVRIVLLGEDVLQTNRVGNFILGRSAFQIEVLSSVKLHCERASGQVEGKNITIINTPHLYNPQLSQEELNQRVKTCITLTDPGPHVFLLVLQSVTNTHKQHNRVKNTLETYSPLSRECSIVITTGKDHGVFSECEVRHHRIHDISAFDKHQVLQLLGKIDMLLKETGGTDLQARKITLRRHQDHFTGETSKTDGETLRENLKENKGK
ncbi:GTPase IMAP family member 4-like [Clarias gariepinus]|uniref:GTPase IMAP family member 4-like n=1 Tax=Clarias gariepinus TaxID=13013 RepID=UPI00234C1C17|nr:GTPase IMAP family member 4-like [Clarias gariepinus]